MAGNSNCICSFLAHLATAVTSEGLLYHCAASALNCNETDYAHRLLLSWTYLKEGFPTCAGALPSHLCACVCVGRALP